MGNYVDDIAKLIVENMEPGQPAMNIPRTYSQLLDAVFTTGPEPVPGSIEYAMPATRDGFNIKLPIEQNIQKVIEYAKNVGVDQAAVQGAIQNIKDSYKYAQGWNGKRESPIGEDVNGPVAGPVDPLESLANRQDDINWIKSNAVNISNFIKSLDDIKAVKLLTFDDPHNLNNLLGNAFTKRLSNMDGNDVMRGLLELFPDDNADELHAAITNAMIFCPDVSELLGFHSYEEWEKQFRGTPNAAQIIGELRAGYGTLGVGDGSLEREGAPPGQPEF